MKLSAYLEAQGRGAISRFAERLKTSKGFISDIAAGRRGCSLAMARLIRIHTNGQVTPDDLAAAREEWLAAQAAAPAEGHRQPPAAA